VWSYGEQLMVPELKLFLAVILVMGLVHAPEIRDYWSEDSKLANEWIWKHMARNRDLKRSNHT
jgi:Transposase IS4